MLTESHVMIPNKSNFKFQELTPITGVKPYVIRFWETEFCEIAPILSDNGQKIYARKDVEAILKIKKLLFEDKLTIAEAKVKMSSPDIEKVQFSIPSIQKDSGEGMRKAIQKTLQLIQEIKSKRNW